MHEKTPKYAQKKVPKYELIYAIMHTFKPIRPLLKREYVYEVSTDYLN